MTASNFLVFFALRRKFLVEALSDLNSILHCYVLFQILSSEARIMRPSPVNIVIRMLRSAFGGGNWIRLHWRHSMRIAAVSLSFPSWNLLIFEGTDGVRSRESACSMSYVQFYQSSTRGSFRACRNLAYNLKSASSHLWHRRNFFALSKRSRRMRSTQSTPASAFFYALAML
ncbi:hypothetical protein BDN70DRAFT_719947 [Pholiota conissans]|uniref:Uncharacterized protein n=1 Tax=Pholiota conissans TaxID=109636 RepID=A0A9P5Z137_9AGAR|nr:hypothetical protein BDN70DRAFT_719947 [Pholiota conissans]